MSIRYFLTCLLVLLSGCMALAQNHLPVSVSDGTSGAPLAFAHCYLQGNKTGTTTDLEGKALLHFPKGGPIRDQLTLSYVGYRDTIIQVQPSDQELRIGLQPKPVLLEAAEIKGQAENLSAEEIVRNAIKFIRKNYSQDAVQLHTFYRESFSEGGQLATVDEAIADIYYTPYPRRWFTRRSFRHYYDGAYEGRADNRFANHFVLLSNPLYLKYYNTVRDQCKILGCRLSDNSSTEGLHPHVQGGPLALLSQDKVKYRSDFLDPAMRGKYAYAKSSAVMLNGHPCYAITFKPLPGGDPIFQGWHQRIKDPIFSGTIYVDIETFAVVAIRCQLSPLARFDNYKKHRAWQVFPDRNTLAIDYQEQNGRWFLKNIKTEQHISRAEFLSPGQPVFQRLSHNYRLTRQLWVQGIEPDASPFDEADDQLLHDQRDARLATFPFEYKDSVWQVFEQTARYPKLSAKEVQALERKGPLHQQWGRWFVKEEMLPPAAAVQTGALGLPNGEQLPDPYRWMERRDSQTQAYINTENRYFFNEYIPWKRQQFSAFRKILMTLEPCDTSTTPPKQPVYRDNRGLFLRDSSGSGPKMLLSFNTDLPPGKTLQSYLPSPEYGALAFTISNGDAYANSAKVKTLASNRVDSLSDQLYEMQWLNENTLVYTVVNESKRAYACYAYQPQHGDRRLLFEATDPEFELELYEVRGTLLLSSLNSNGNELFRLEEHAGRVKLKRLHGTDWYSTDFYFDEDAYYLAARDTAFQSCLLKTEGNAEQILWTAPATTALDEVRATADYILAKAIDRAKVKLYLFSKNGELRDSLPLPELHGSAQLGEVKDYASNTCRYYFESPNQPFTQYTINLVTRQLTEKPLDCLRKPTEAYYENILHEVPAEDGEWLPLRLSYRSDFKNLKATKGVLLSVYGAYGAFSEATFDEYERLLMDEGYVVAQVSVRGSRAKGWQWYRAGRGANKSVGISDYLACATYVRQELQLPKTFAYGQSAGGLIVAAALNKNPQLFDAAILDYPFLDALGVSLDSLLPLTSLEYPEWGYPGRPAELQALQAYSPYQNIKPQTYPPILMLGGLYDLQTPYWQIMKAAARYRALQTNDAPILLHLGKNYHPGSIPYRTRVREMTYQYLFLENITSK
jgi:oligopeptidase B